MYYFMGAKACIQLNLLYFTAILILRILTIRVGYIFWGFSPFINPNPALGYETPVTFARRSISATDCNAAH